VTGFKDTYTKGERVILGERHKNELGELGMYQHMLHVEFTADVNVRQAYQEFKAEGQSSMLSLRPEQNSASEECQFAQYLKDAGLIKIVPKPVTLIVTDVIRDAAGGEL